MTVSNRKVLAFGQGAAPGLFILEINVFVQSFSINVCLIGIMLFLDRHSFFIDRYPRPLVDRILRVVPRAEGACPSTPAFMPHEAKTGRGWYTRVERFENKSQSVYIYKYV